MGERRGIYRILVTRPEGKRPLGTLKSSWEDSKINLQKCDWKTWTGLIWLRIGTGSGLL
jgi:hypothetical protein